MSSSLLFTENRPIMKSLTLPALSLPMKLVSLEEAQARSLATNHPARKERRENSLPEIVPPMGTLFHTVLELPDNKSLLPTSYLSEPLFLSLKTPAAHGHPEQGLTWQGLSIPR